MIQGIVSETRENIRTVLDAGLTEGRNPRQTALEIAGRLDKATGKRTGGIIGLTSGQTDAVIRARGELANLDANYFTRARRDARFDPMVRKAIGQGKPLSVEEIDRITGRYKDRLLAYRAEVIARTETLGALSASREEGMRQLIEAGKVDAQDVTKIWRATGDARTRDTHQELDGQAVAWGEAFTSPSGARLLYPHDKSLGAPPKEIIQCRCFWETRIDFKAALRRQNGVETV